MKDIDTKFVNKMDGQTSRLDIVETIQQTRYNWKITEKINQNATFCQRMRTFERKVETDGEMTWFNIQPTEVVEEKNQNEWARNSICNSQRTDERNISRIKKRPESSDRRGTRMLGGITKSRSPQEKRERSC